MNDAARRVEAWSRDKKPGPFKIQLNPTNRCNLECQFCWQRTNEKINYEEVSDGRYLDLIEEASALDIRRIEITGGGEPLLRKELLFELVEKIKDAGIKGKLITNGTEFNREDLGALVDCSWDEVVFSVDGPKEVHNYLRQADGCFEETVSSMRTLDEISDGKPKMTMHTVLCKENYDKIEETLRLAEETGCDNFFIEPVVTLAFDTEMGKNLKMSREEIEEVTGNTEKLKKIANKLDINHNLDDLEEELVDKTNQMTEVIKKDAKRPSPTSDSIERAACFEPWHNMIIRPEGDVGPCCMFDNKGPKIQENSLEEIWFGEYFEELRQRMIKGDLLSFCSKCNPSQVSENRKIRKELLYQ